MLSPNFSPILKNPRLLITVATTVLSERIPLSFISNAHIAIILSPSTSVPFSSTAKTRSASPSNASPASAPHSLTNSQRLFRCVEPHPLFMLIPSGLSQVTNTFAPSFSRAFFAVTLDAPLAQSMAILSPSRRTSVVDTAKSIYLSTKVLSSVQWPIRSCVARTTSSDLSRIIPSIRFSVSSLSLYPSPLKNLIPLCSKGLCDAEIITPASNPHFLTR